MALQVGELFAKLTLDSSSYDMSLDKAKGKLNDITRDIKIFGAAAVAGMGLGVKAGLDFDQQIQNNTVAFTTMLKDAGQAKDLMKELKDFAASTPYEFPEIAASGKELLAFGFSAKEIQPNLTMLGDIASGIGMNIGDLAEIYGKAKVQGRLFGEDINQLTGRGIPITKALADTMGVAQSQVKDLVSEGKIGFPELEKAMQSLTGEGGQFAGMMVEQSKTFSGQWGTFQDTLNEALGDAIKPFFQWMSTEGFPKATQMVGELGDAVQWLKKHSDELLPLISGLGAAFATWKILSTINALMVAYKASLFATTLATEGLTAAMATNPFGLAAIAIGLLVAAGVALYRHWDEIKAKLDELKDSFKKKFDEIKEKVLGVFDDMPDKLKEIGINVLKGLANGILFGLPGAISSVVEIGGKIINKFKEVFKTHSPSEITTDIGSFLTEGLGVGVKNAEEKAMTPLQKLTEGMLEKVKKFAEETVNSGTSIDMQTKALLENVNALLKENEQTQLSVDYLKQRVTEIKNVTAAIEAENKVLEQNAKLTAQIDSDLESGRYTGSHSARNESASYYAANKSAIDAIAVKNGVDTGTAAAMLRSDQKTGKNEYGGGSTSSSSAKVSQSINIVVKSASDAVKEVVSATKAIVSKIK